MKKVSSLKSVISLYSFIFVVWGFYRFLVPVPPEISEVVLKPLVWLVPLIWIFRREGLGLGSVGWTTKNLFKSIYLAVALGLFFAVEGALINSIKYGTFNFLNLNLTQSMLLGALGISLVTAISEETVFRGFIFSRVWQALRGAWTPIKSEWTANVLTSISWAAVHLPVTIFVFRYTPEQILVFMLLTFLFGVASSFVYARTGNVASSVLLHVFWEWPIILFR